MLRCLKPEDWQLRKSRVQLLRPLFWPTQTSRNHFSFLSMLQWMGWGRSLVKYLEGEKKPRRVAFANKTLSKSQSRYPAHRLEFFALKWAVCKKFAHWLKGNRFTVLTDNNPLTYIMTKPKLDACEQRWVSKIAPFDFDLKYIPGT